MSDESDVYKTGFIEHIEILDDAEDVKTVRFEGQRGTADVKVTDDTMVEFLQTADSVFQDIHTDMAELKDEADRDGRSDE